MIQVSHEKQYISPFIVSLKDAKNRIKKARSNGKTVGLCHGGFDLLHPGHIKHFKSARALCDILVVSITADEFVTLRKGLGRPIFTDTLRAYMVASLRAVDFVVISPFKTGVDIIKALKPSFYIKGPDFIGKQTPGIQAERTAIQTVGGEMKYTSDPPSSTTAIIEYIKKEIREVSLLLIVDRDGTLITNNKFFGKEKDWKARLTLNRPVVSLLSYLKTKYRAVMIVITNQQGVARGYFTEKKVYEINHEITESLMKQGIGIASWQVCPDVDETYSKQHPEVTWLKTYVKKKTNRKPSTDMVEKALKVLGKTSFDFNSMLVLGNDQDDALLAKHLHASYINVSAKNYEILVKECERAIKYHMQYHVQSHT